jgi:hypothetical protein
MFSLDYFPNLGSTACQGSECDGLIAEGYLPVKASYTFFDVLRASLKKVMTPLQGVKVGLMINHDHINNCAGPTKAAPQENPNNNCSNGGYIALGFRSFQKDDDNGAKAAFHKFLADMPTPQGVQSHKYQGKELFFEFYRYLSGQGVYNGHVGYTDSTRTIQITSTLIPLISWDTDVEAAGSTSHQPTAEHDGCEDLHGQHHVPGLQPGNRLENGHQGGRGQWRHGTHGQQPDLPERDPVAAGRGPGRRDQGHGA